MSVSELITQIHIIAKGNGRVPASGSDKYAVYLSIANRKQTEWATEPRTPWRDLYDEVEVGTLSTDTLEYEYDTEIIDNSDYLLARLTLDDGSVQEHKLEVSSPHDRDGGDVYIYNKIIKFTEVPAYLDGATLILPCYIMPDALVGANDEVTVTDPYWLAYATAAEIVRNDPAKDDQFDNVTIQANDRWDKMTSRNKNNGFKQNNRIPVKMRR